jgi:1-acyl-sn-glycerol-3-phosphate acyltransferase
VVLLRTYRLLLIILASLFFLATGIGVLVFLIAGQSTLARARALCAMLWAKTMCGILGIRINKGGELVGERDSFTVCNHISYLDIFVLGSIRPSVFLAKHAVRNWPIAGWMANLAGTVFINRESKKNAVDAMGVMEDRIDSGVNVVMFPGGTTSDGKRINPFKSSLFNLPAGRNFTVSPLSIRYTGINGKYVTPDMLDKIAWYGEMRLVPHFWDLLGLRSIEAALHFNPVIEPSGHSVSLSIARKRLCTLSYESIVSGFAHCGQK